MDYASSNELLSHMYKCYLIHSVIDNWENGISHFILSTLTGRLEDTLFYLYLLVLSLAVT